MTRPRNRVTRPGRGRRTSGRGRYRRRWRQHAHSIGDVDWPRRDATWPSLRSGRSRRASVPSWGRRRRRQALPLLTRHRPTRPRYRLWSVWYWRRRASGGWGIGIMLLLLLLLWQSRSARSCWHGLTAKFDIDTRVFLLL